MLTPAKPENEAARLAALHALDILDTPSEERFDRITRLAARLFGTPIAMVSLVDSERQWFKSSVGVGVPETAREVSFCGHGILGNDAFVVPDASKDERFADNPLVTGDPHIRFYSGYPLHGTGGEVLGMLCVIDRVPREFDSTDVVALSDLAALVESELGRQQLSAAEQELRRELSEAEMRASVDSLTRLWNRGHVLKFLELEYERARREGGSLQAGMLDIDHFKKVNDTYGHLAGDAVLREMAARFRQAVRPYDTLGRYGGEEFVLVMSNCSQEAARGVAERIRQLVEATPIDTPAGFLPVTISIGLSSTLVKDGAGTTALLDSADQALYRAKDNGRNQVVLAEDARWPLLDTSSA